MSNVDIDVVNDFGNEWHEYNQQKKFQEEFNINSFNNYFSIFPDNILHKNSIGFDAGCGSGRWAKFIAPKVKHLNCFDASDKALRVTQENLSEFDNCSFQCCSINDWEIADNSQDFGYCLGVLHHIPNTESALKKLVTKLKKGAPLLIYLYYKFDDKPFWFFYLWKVSDFFRKKISIMPHKNKLLITKIIAFFIYLPLAKLSFYLEKSGFDVSNIPLSVYRNQNFYSMQTDSLDRFGTRLEKRFTKREIRSLMQNCNLKDIKFSKSEPFWVAIGYR